MKSKLIDRIREYIHLSDSEIETVDSLFYPEEYKANDVILKEGDICSKIWFIEKGLVRFSINADGEDRSFVFRCEGHFISEIEGFIRRTPASKSIVAIEDCLLYSMTETDIQRFYQMVRYGDRFGRLLIEEIFVAAVAHIVSFYTESPEQRYQKLIRQNKDFIQRIPQYHIASFLGVKPQSLCRIKKRLLSKQS